MIVFTKDLTLSQKLKEYNKESLKTTARYLGITGISTLKKDELVEVIAKKYLEPEVMYYRMSIFDDKAIELFERGFNGTVNVGGDEKAYDIVCMLNEIEYAAVSKGEYLIPCDVVKVWKKIRTNEFEMYRKRASWVWKCLHFAEELYGICPIEKLLGIVNIKKGISMDEDELIKIFDHFPIDMVWSTRIDNLIVSDIYADDIDELKSLRIEQADKPFYVPTVEEVEEMFEVQALTSEKSYRDLAKYLKKELHMDPMDVEDLIEELWENIATIDDYHENLQWFMEELVLDKESQVQDVINHFMQCMNNTRMVINRGFKPIELHRLSGTGNGKMPTIVPGSSKAASMLKDVAPKIKDMGFDVELDGNAVEVPVVHMPAGLNGPAIKTTQKVYPNDPCPCGSGKKFKKCCGRTS